MRLLSSLVLAAAVAAPVHAASAQSGDAALDRAVAAYAKVKTIRATFEQTLRNPLTGTTVTARGEIQQRRPNQLSVRFTDPKGDRIVADGRSVWVYMPSSNPGQVIKMPVEAAAGGSLDLTAQFLDAPRKRFTITDGGAAKIGSRSARLLTLVPKEPSTFATAKVWIDDADGLVRQFEVTDANGLTRLVRLTSLRLNAGVDASAFSFTPPKGVQVFDQGRMR